jgi:hypothetical protein
VAEIIGGGADLETVRKVERLLYPAEHKPRQGEDPGLPGLTPNASISPAGPAGTSERFEE